MIGESINDCERSISADRRYSTQDEAVTVGCGDFTNIGDGG